MKREKEREREKKTFMLEVLALVAMCCNVLQHDASVLQCKKQEYIICEAPAFVAVCCSVLQYVAMWFRMLQCEKEE